MKMHGYFELTIAMALLQEDGTILHDDMVDVTLAFGVPTPQPLRPLTDEETAETLRSNIGRVLAVIQSVLIVNGMESLDQVTEGERLIDGSHTIMGEVRSDPQRVQVTFVEEGRA